MNAIIKTESGDIIVQESKIVLGPGSAVWYGDTKPIKVMLDDGKITFCTNGKFFPLGKTIGDMTEAVKQANKILQ